MKIKQRITSIAFLLLIAALLLTGCGAERAADNPMGASVSAVAYTRDPEGRVCFLVKYKQDPAFDCKTLEKDGAPCQSADLHPLLKVWDGEADTWVEYQGLLFTSRSEADQRGNGTMYLYQSNFVPMADRFTPEKEKRYKMEFTLSLDYYSLADKAFPPKDAYPLGEKDVTLQTYETLYRYGE